MVNNIAYFDNAATTFPKPENVYVTMDKFYRECGVNIGRGQHKLSSMANALMEQTRDKILNLFHCSNKQVVFTHTATEALNLILFGLNMPKGAVVYFSPFEHNSVTRALNHLVKTQEIQAIQLAANKDKLQLDFSEIQVQFGQVAPDYIVISHASNVCGTIAPVEAILSLGKRYQATTIVDMCQTAGLIDIDLSSDIYDFAVFEGHKTLYGPMGIGGFVMKKTVELSPLIYGGTGVESANQDMPTSFPAKYEAGSHNIQAIAGLNASLTWINQTGINTIHDVEQSNREILISLLTKYSNLKMYMPSDGIGVVSCTFDGYSSDSIGQVLSEKNIAVRTGLQCSPFAHKLMGTFPSGTVRFSVSYFNNDEDFVVLREALDYIEYNS